MCPRRGGNREFLYSPPVVILCKAYEPYKAGKPYKAYKPDKAYLYGAYELHKAYKAGEPCNAYKPYIHNECFISLIMLISLF